MGVVGSAAGLERVYLPAPQAEDILRDLQACHPQGRRDEAAFGDLIPRLQGCWRGERASFPDPVAMSGATAFRRAVWEAARAIPWGETRTYGWLAAQVGRPGAARAVGQALGANPCPIVVPCHRVVGRAGPGGFSGGLALKERLLALEGAAHQALPQTQNRAW